MAVKFSRRPEGPRPPVEKWPEDSAREKVLSGLKETGWEGQIEKDVIGRLVLLEQKSKFNEDSRLIGRGMANVLDFLEEHHAREYPQLALTGEQKRDGRVAGILHDIGKSGPAGATKRQQEAVVRIFALEKVNDPARPVEDVAAENFPGREKEKILRDLRGCGVDPEMTMREFWDRHAQWTHDILESHHGELSEHARVIAGSHHISRGINPYRISESEIPLQASLIGALEDYSDVLSGRVLMALDQYEASVRRGGATHEEALECVRRQLGKFGGEKFMQLVFEAIDRLGQEGKIFQQASPEGGQQSDSLESGKSAQAFAK